MAPMTTMLASTDVVEVSKRTERPSIIREEVLVLLKRPARFPLAIQEIRSELFPLFSRFEISNGITDHLEDGVVRATYTSGYETVVVWAEEFDRGV